MDLFANTTAQTREYQIRIVKKTIQMFDGSWLNKAGHKLPPAKSVLIDAPTGSGKTIMGLAIAQYASQVLGKRIGWSAMRHHLLRQAEEMRTRFGFKIPNMRYISMFDKNPPTDVDWLFVDEAQHDATYSMSVIHAAIHPEKVIGLSATPYRSDHITLAFERIIRDVGIHTLIDEGWLSQYDHYTIQDYNPESVAEMYIRYRPQWGKSIAFFLTMEQCERARAALTKGGVRTEIVYADSDKDNQISRFKAKKLDVLISMQMLAEGFDDDDLQTVFIRPSSRGPVTQMGGRVLRICDSLPVKNIVQCQDTRCPFVKVARPRRSFVLTQSGFRSLTSNDNIDKMVQMSLQNLMHANVEMPQFVIKKNKINRTNRPGEHNPVTGQVHVTDRARLAQRGQARTRRRQDS